MGTSKLSGVIIIAMMVIAALYTAWTVTGSSRCVMIGVEHQTRTTFAPFEGCRVVDDFRAPDWMYGHNKETH